MLVLELHKNSETNTGKSWGKVGGWWSDKVQKSCDINKLPDLHGHSRVGFSNAVLFTISVTADRSNCCIYVCDRALRICPC